MTATAAQIERLRRMVAEPSQDTYNDADLQGYIEAYPTLDKLGHEPVYWNYLTVPASQVVNPEWIPTYDLNAAAAEIWLEKASVLAADFDFSADGGNFTRSQAYQQAMTQSRHFHSKRCPGTITLTPAPIPPYKDKLP